MVAKMHESKTFEVGVRACGSSETNNTCNVSLP